MNQREHKTLVIHVDAPQWLSSTTLPNTQSIQAVADTEEVGGRTDLVLSARGCSRQGTFRIDVAAGVRGGGKVGVLTRRVSPKV